jgi:hypothetical protein
MSSAARAVMNNDGSSSTIIAPNGYLAQELACARARKATAADTNRQKY